MSKKKKKVLVIAILLVIGAGVGFYFYSKKKQVSPKQTQRLGLEQAPQAASPASTGVLPGTPLTREEEVKQIYRSVLGREADASGLAYWTSTGLSIEEIRSRFYASDEYKQRVA